MPSVPTILFTDSPPSALEEQAPAGDNAAAVSFPGEEIMSSSVLGVMLLSLGGAATGAEEPRLDVRVGIVAYQDFHLELGRLDGLLAELSKANPALRFRLAPGTYADVVHWLERDTIDVAVLSPGVFAETQKGEAPRCRYLATLSKGPAKGPLALPDRREPGPHFQYRSACVVSADSPLKNTADLQAAAEAGRIQYLFVDPLSVSGRIAPEFALKQMGIRPAKEQVQFTYSHSNSLRLVTEPVEGLQRVAFVWDDALIEGDQQERIRRLDFPELNALMIAQDAIAVRAGFKQVDAVAKVLQDRPEMGRLEDWEKRYGVIQKWSEAIGLSLGDLREQKVSLHDIGQDLLHYARSHHSPPRLAVVLSGGGAKCAFQVGAVKALEEVLGDLRKKYGDQGLDIALVVGTSGGAINSLPVALGITATPEGQEDIAALWLDMDQRQLIRPALRIRLGVGLWLALLQMAVVVGIVRRRVKDPPRRGWIAASVFVVLGVLETVIAYLPWAPWSFLGPNHTLHHVWLVGSFGTPWTGGILLGAGLAGLGLQWHKRRKQQYLTFSRRLSAYFFLATLLGLPLAVVLCLLLVEQTLSDHVGVERALIHKCSWVIDRHLKRNDLAALDTGSASTNKDRLAALSRQIINRGLLRRDLAITGSCLSRTSLEFPADLYFFAPSPPRASQPRAKPPRFGNQGVALKEKPAILLDVLMGSGAAYPIFPPRTLEGFPQAGERVQLVDGGFAHNSPLEAAVLWDATHIVLIEAFLEGRVSGNNLLENTAGAVEHLWLQAQQLDARKRGQVVIYSIRPEPPHLCLLDFADNLIQKAMDKGYREGRGEIPAQSRVLVGRPGFRKELGEPQFLAVEK
jgi:predicted acylesterase/phospholipase RssA/ABC-type phosphate/phosphonate transport system substrate-binding protein